MPRGWAVDLTADSSAPDHLPKPPGYIESHHSDQVSRHNSAVRGDCTSSSSCIQKVRYPRWADSHTVGVATQDNQITNRKVDQTQLKLKVCE